MLSLLLASPLASQPAHADEYYMYEDEIEYALAVSYTHLTLPTTVIV